MNRLLNIAPYSIIIDDIYYKIDTSFRSALLTFSAFRNKDFSPEEKQGILIHNLYVDKVDKYSIAMLEKATWFLKCGKENEKENHDKPTINFEQDSEFIHNAFLKRDINLDKVDLHWWHFMGYFSELPECFLSRLIYLRMLNNKGKLSRKEYKLEREECQRIGWNIINIQGDFDILDEDPDWLK